MLQGINAIDWTSVHHAFGEASDIPALLQALLSPDAGERAKALERLDDLVHHQGTIYEAAVYVAPFLMEMLRSPETPDKESIAGVWALLAQGKPPHNYDDEKSKRLMQAILPQGLDLAAVWATEREWIRILKEMVGDNLPLLYPYLEAREPTVRWIVAYTVALYPDHMAESLPLLERALALEQKPDVKAGIASAIEELKASSR